MWIKETTEALIRKPIWLAIALLAGCTISTEPRVGEEFTLEPGERVRIAETQLTVTFEEVADDSRCPLGVVCVWEGDGVVELRIADVDGVRVVMLHTNPQFDQSVEVAGVELKLISLSPYPETPGPIEPGTYEVTLQARALQ